MKIIVIRLFLNPCTMIQKHVLLTSCYLIINVHNSVTTLKQFMKHSWHTDDRAVPIAVSAIVTALSSMFHKLCLILNIFWGCAWTTWLCSPCLHDLSQWLLQYIQMSKTTILLAMLVCLAWGSFCQNVYICISYLLYFY